MRGLKLWMANLLCGFLPQTRCFGVRRAAYEFAGVQVGSGSKINGMVRIHYPNVFLGRETWLGAGTHVISTDSASVSIGDRCDVGPGCMFVVGSHEIASTTRRAGLAASEPIEIGDGTWIGARSTFLAGAGTGSGCVVAAGSVVTKRFGDNILIGGVPARVLRKLPQT